MDLHVDSLACITPPSLRLVECTQLKEGRKEGVCVCVCVCVCVRRYCCKVLQSIPPIVTGCLSTWTLSTVAKGTHWSSPQWYVCARTCTNVWVSPIYQAPYIYICCDEAQILSKSYICACCHVIAKE